MGKQPGRKYPRRKHNGFCFAGCVTRITREGKPPLDLTWNGQYQFVSVSTNGVFAESYAYDALGRRVSTTTLEGTVRHVYDDSWQCLVDIDEGGSVLRSYVWGEGIANKLDSGEDFGKLRDTYVIFITENDVMGDGLEVYVYDRTERKSGKRLGDGTYIIYVNGATRSETEIGKLVHDLLCRDAAKMYFDVFKKRVNEFKKSEEGRRAMCKAVEEYAERRAAESKAEGERKGKRETMLAMAKRMLKDGILALKDIARYSGLSLAQVKKLQAEMA